MVDYGWGVKADYGGSWEFDKAGKSKIIEDRENLGQQLTFRLKSPKGSHPFDQDFGMDISGINRYRKMYRDMHQVIEVAVSEALIGNKGIKRVEQVISTHLGNRLWEVIIKVISKDNKEYWFSTIFEENSSVMRDYNE